MTSKKKLLLAVACSVAVSATAFTGATEAASNPFAAVPTSSKSYEDVAALVDSGLIYGYTKGQFDKTRPISRMEMAIFTGKAMTAMDRASAADAERINRLIKEYQSELTDLHVQIPGVKPKAGDGKATAAAKDARIKKIPEGFSLDGMIRLRMDHGNKSTQNAGHDSRLTEHNQRVYYTINTSFGITKDWKANLLFVGERGIDGAYHDGDGTTGLFDVSQAYVNGPGLGGVWRLGYTKGSRVYGSSIVMNEYYTGAEYVRTFDKKWKGGITFAKIDYSKDNYLNKDGDIWANSRGQNNSVMNPNNLGVNMWQFQTAYQASKNFGIVASLWKLHSNKSGEDNGNKKEYGNPYIGEVGFNWDVSRKLGVKARYAQSSWDAGNQASKKAYGLMFTWGKASASNPHSNQFSLDFMHSGRNSNIKSSSDIRGRLNYSQRGIQLKYDYIPVKNVMLTARYIHDQTYSASSKSNEFIENQYRFEAKFYF